MATTQQKKFIDLLEEIFQFDQADLDFGIYRIMNQKREEVTNFLNNELVPQVKKAFDKYRNADVEAIKQQMEELEQKLNEMGVAKDSSEKYLILNKRLNKGVDITALENEVFSDLTNFFRRYYHEGDFLSLRRYKKDVYAIPYEGEEVKLHWANADQYYVKTSEYFRDYTFKLPSRKTVHLKLIEANTEQNNNKAQEGKERRFILFEEEPVKEENGEFYIHFEYRPVEGKETQKQLNESAVEYLFSLGDYNEWLKELQTLSPTEKNKKRTVLEKYLNDYTSRNTFDYFIHKDLGGFLRRELDFFIKNEIMHLDDLDTENEIRFEQYLSKVKVLKSIGHKIITFIEQIENFQKKLWLKKKFVVEGDYCITLDNIPEEFYEEIGNNREQIDEWINLASIDKLDDFSIPLTAKFLKHNKYLMVDTKHFNSNFKDKLLTNFEDIDNQIDGVLVHSENFQALNLLQETYQEKVKTVYIDPPYNTAASEILYKNNYKHSSWLSLMQNGLPLGRNLLTKNGLFNVAIDEEEQRFLNLLCDNVFGQRNYIANISVMHNPKGRDAKHIASSHEYVIMYAKDIDSLDTYEFEHSGKEIEKKYPLVDEDGRYRELPLRRTGSESLRSDRPSMYFPFYYNPETGDLTLENPKMKGWVEILPIDENKVDRRWRWGKPSCQNAIDNKELVVRKVKDKYVIYNKDRADNWYKPKSFWYGEKYDASSKGTNLLKNILGNKIFDYPKSLYLVKDTLAVSMSKKDIVIDYFAGSGTTGHAVIEMNREDNGNRKYVLVEMGEHFNNVLLPRIKKAVYSKDWKSGKPVNYEGTSHMVKYIKLESYEDTLNNIRLNRSSQQQAAMDEVMSTDAREEYLLSYMLNVETEGSPSLLNVEAFNNPFDYKMKITEGTETKPTEIDLVETFNYLIGLHVKTIDMIKGIKVITGALRNGEEVLILWRNTDEVSNEQLEDFFKKQGYNTRDTEFDRIYVNGDNHLENLKLAEDKWKVVLIEEEFKRLMFDVYDV